jgi:hypothetical protein
MPTPTNRYFNVSSCGFTPSGGSLSTISGVKSISFDENPTIETEGGDFDVFDTVMAVAKIEPSFSVETLDAWGLYSVLAGSRGALVCTARDAVNGVTTGGGAKLITISNAFINKRGSNQQHRQFGKQTIGFGCISSDGATHPVAVSAV